MTVAITLGTVLVVVAAFRRRPRRTDIIVLSLGLVAGMLVEIVVGGEAVLYKLAPQFVMPHFLLALAPLVDAVALVAVVTSTGPHAGAPGVPRFHFSLYTVAQLHGTAVELLLVLTVATLWSLHRSMAAPAVLHRGEVLLVVLVSQAALGYTQYLTGGPVLLVGVHEAGRRPSSSLWSFSTSASRSTARSRWSWASPPPGTTSWTSPRYLARAERGRPRQHVRCGAMGPGHPRDAYPSVR